MCRRKIITLGATHLDVNESFKEHLKNEMYGDDIEFCNNLISAFGKFVGMYSVNGSNHRRRNGKRNRKKYKDMYSFWDDESYSSHGSECDFYGCVDNNSKIICYYRDINQPDDVEEFYDLHSFQNFLETEEVELDDTEYNDLMNRYSTHCCINPMERLENGRLKLMTADTYGNLRWDYVESEESVSEPSNI